IGSCRDFAQTIAGKPALCQTIQQSPEWIFLEIEVAHMDRKNLVFHHIEIRIEPLALEVGLIAVPADADHLMICDVHDPLDIREQRGAGAVDFEPDLNSVPLAEVPQLAE